jgi:RNA polymerase sigma factor (sigma-70 family)
MGTARRSDEHAWTQLHRQFDSTLRSIARSRGLSSHDVEDAIQNTWIKLHARIDSIRESTSIAGWLATTVRRESLRLLQTTCARSRPMTRPLRPTTGGSASET